MTHKEYEQRYAEALDVVRRKIPNVGQPETMPDGARFVALVEYGATMSLSSDWHGAKKPHGTSWTKDRRLVDRATIGAKKTRSTAAVSAAQNVRNIG